MIQGRIKENHPNKKLRGKKVELIGCRAADGAGRPYEYRVFYKDSGLLLNEWVEEKYIDLNLV